MPSGVLRAILAAMSQQLGDLGHLLGPAGTVGREHSCTQCFSLIVFEDGQQARAATPPAAGWTAPSVTIESVELRRVAVAVP